MGGATGARGLFAGFGPLLVKELQELARERRLPVLILVLGVALAAAYSLFSDVVVGGGNGPTFGQVLVPLAYLGPLVVTVAAVTFAADAVSKERDSGMLGLVLSCPVAPGGLFLAKVAGGLAAYAALAGFILLFYGALAPTLGWTVVEAAAWMLAVPLLALYVFASGVGVLASVAADGSRKAVGATAGVLLPLFFLMQSPPGLGFLIKGRAPRLWSLLEFSPLDMAAQVSRSILVGAPFWWPPVLFALLLGAALHGAAFALLARQEAAA